MPASDFALTPTLCTPILPQFETAILRTEDLTRDYSSLEDEGLNRYRLSWVGMSDVDFKTLWNHFIAREGSGEAFDWLNANIPSYIKSLISFTTQNMTGRWIKGSFHCNPKSSSWETSIEFEES